MNVSKIRRHLLAAIREVERGGLVFYGPKHVAEMLGVEYETVLKMCADGALEHARIGGRGDYRIPAYALEKLIVKKK